MVNLTVQLHGEDPATLDDMGEGTLIFSQRNEATGRLESVVLDWGQLMQAVEAMRPRYGCEPKNTEPSELETA